MGWVDQDEGSECISDDMAIAFFDAQAGWRCTSQHTRYSDSVEHGLPAITVKYPYCTIKTEEKYEMNGVVFA